MILNGAGIVEESYLSLVAQESEPALTTELINPSKSPPSQPPQPTPVIVVDSEEQKPRR